MANPSTCSAPNGTPNDTAQKCTKDVHGEAPGTCVCARGPRMRCRIAHLPHYPCCQRRRFPWRRCIQAPSSRSGRHTASCSDPACISRCRCTDRDSHLLGETEKMRRGDVRPWRGAGGSGAIAMQGSGLGEGAGRRKTPHAGARQSGKGAYQMQGSPGDTDLCGRVSDHLPIVGDSPQN